MSILLALTKIFSVVKQRQTLQKAEAFHAIHNSVLKAKMMAKVKDLFN